MSGKLRESDYIGRFGGDEFLILLPRTRQQREVHIAQRTPDARPCSTSKIPLRIGAAWEFHEAQ